MKNHSQKIQLVSALLFFLASLFALMFLYQEVKAIEQRSEQKLKEWRAESSRREEIKSLENLMAKIKDEEALIQTHFAYSSNIVPFLDKLEKLALSVKAKSEVLSVKISEGEDTLMVGLRLTGSFESFYRFLTLLENSAYDLELISVEIKKFEKNWSATLKIKLLTFVR